MKIWPFSVPAYHALGEAGLIPKNTELLYGIIYLKMAKSPVHCALVSRLIKSLQNAIEAGPGPKMFVRPEQPITCADSEPEPDLCVVRGTEEDYLGEHPTRAELVIEVCVSSHDYDRSKLRAYALAKVKECWLVLEPEKQVEVYQKPIGGAFQEKLIFGPGGKLASKAVKGLAVDLGRLFAK